MRFTKAKRVRWLSVLLLMCCALGFILWARVAGGTSPDRQVDAENLVISGLMAIKRVDGPGVLGLMHSKSGESVVLSKHPARVPKIVKHIKDYFRLGDWSEPEIRASVETMPSVDRRLVESILRDSFWPGERRPSWDEMSPVVVLYRIDGRDMISIVVKEGGKWRLTCFPCCISARVLKYRDARVANLNGDLCAEDVIDPRIQNKLRRGGRALD